MSRSDRTWLWAGLVLAAGVGLVVGSAPSRGPGGGAQRPPRRRFLVSGARVLLAGDSHAQGLAVPMAKLAAESSVPFLADGRSGTRIDQWAKADWLADALATHHPTVVFLSLGTNDMLLADPIKQRPHRDAVRTLIKNAKAELVWIAPPTMPFPDRGVRALLAEGGAIVFPSEALNIPRAGDKIHATVAGYAGWAATLWKWAS